MGGVQALRRVYVRNNRRQGEVVHSACDAGNQARLCERLRAERQFLPHVAIRERTRRHAEALAHFFRRYAYNEWYPLTKEEFAAYAADCPEPVAPYSWQRENTDAGDGET